VTKADVEREDVQMSCSDMSHQLPDKREIYSTRNKTCELGLFSKQFEWQTIIYKYKN
jgi:hypothetical protein